MTLALIIVDHGGIRRILANENRIAVRPSALALDALLDWSRGNKGDILLQQIRAQRAQRRDVIYYPDATSVRGDIQIIVARLNCQVGNGDGRKMLTFKLRLICPAINRNPESKFRTEEKKI